MLRSWYLILCWMLSSLLPGTVAAQQTAAPASGQSIEVIRVGITEYQNIEETYAKYQDFFQELFEKWQKGNSASSTGRDVAVKFKFRIAVGTYEEVREWYNTNRIDVAVLSAMPLTEMLASLPINDDVLQSSAGSQEAALKEKIKAAYLGTLTPLRGRSPFDQCSNGGAGQVLFDELYSDEEKRFAGGSDDYRTVCLVPNDSPIVSADALAQSRGRLRFLFVRPYSVSGYLLPAFNLLKSEPHIDITTEDYEFTYQHTKTLERLRNAKGGMDSDGKYLVGCVLDTTRECPERGGGSMRAFKKVAGLIWNKHTPAETVLLNYHLEQGRLEKIASIMTTVFDRWREDEKSLFRLVKKSRPEELWEGAYQNVREPVLKVTKPASFSHRSTLDEIIEDLLSYKKLNRPIRPLRLALVLSGGGAKCAYQLGAVNALEKKLREKGLDIDLVVGTSGGAINALFVAMGASKTDEGQKCLRDMWAKFRQEDFFQPSLAFNFIFGLSFGFLQALLITATTLLFGRDLVSWNALGKALVALILAETTVAIYVNIFSTLSEGIASFILNQVLIIYIVAAVVRLLRLWVRDWWKQAGWLMCFLSFVEIVIKWSPEPAHWPFGFGDSHVFVHLWLLLKLFSVWSAPFPLLLGLVMLSSGYRYFPTIDFNTQRTRIVRALSVGLLCVMSASLLHSLFKEGAPSDARGIESKFADEIPALVSCIWSGEKIEPGVVVDINSKLKAISRKIVGSRLERDLVVTASRLPIDYRYEKTAQEPMGGQSNRLDANELPEDLYFYYDREGGGQPAAEPPPRGKQFIPFAENKDKLLDVVIGSGTIYPLFPYREIEQVSVDKREVNSVRIIDGGFIHNSPIDAAVKWNATHIILIEASPLVKSFAPNNFLDNTLVAFNYLFSQAQNIDTSTRGDTEIFELRPTSQCEKMSRLYKCDETPTPRLDTFDFASKLLRNAYGEGQSDMLSPHALLTRRSGPPNFRYSQRIVPELLRKNDE